MTKRYLLGTLIGFSAAITKEDLIFIISVVITILNLYLEYLSRKKRKTP